MNHRTTPLSLVGLLSLSSIALLLTGACARDIGEPLSSCLEGDEVGCGLDGGAGDAAAPGGADDTDTRDTDTADTAPRPDVADVPVVEAVCGDMKLEGDEGCDDGRDNSDTTPGACRTDCRPARCGDGVTDHDETCDDGPENGLVGACPADCQLPCTPRGEGCDDVILCEGAWRCNDGSDAPSCDTYSRRPGDGDYWLDPDGEAGEPAFKAFCDQTTDGGGWTRLEPAYAAVSVYDHNCGGMDLQPCAYAPVAPLLSERRLVRFEWNDREGAPLPAAQRAALARLSSAKRWDSPGVWAFDVDDWVEFYRIRFVFDDAAEIEVEVEAACDLDEVPDGTWVEVTGCLSIGLHDPTSGHIPVSVEVTNSVNSGYWFDLSGGGVFVR